MIKWNASKLANLISDPKTTPAIIARLTGLSITYVKTLRDSEDSNPSVETLEKMANFFEKPPEYFFDHV